MALNSRESKLAIPDSMSRFFVDAALALLLGRGVDAARVALAFCVDETL